MNSNETPRLFRLKVPDIHSPETEKTFSQELFETATTLIQAHREMLLTGSRMSEEAIKASQNSHLQPKKEGGIDEDLKQTGGKETQSFPDP